MILQHFTTKERETSLSNEIKVIKKNLKQNRQYIIKIPNIQEKENTSTKSYYKSMLAT